MSAPLAALESEGSGILAQIQGYVVVDAASAAVAVSWLKKIKAYLTRVGEVLDPIVEAAHQAHKTAVGQRTKLREHALKAEAVLKERLATYEQQETRKRQEAEAAARREQDRREAEARAAAEAEQERLRREAETRKLADALEALDRGGEEAAARVMDAPITVPVVVPAPVAPVALAAPPPKIEGVAFREDWKAEVVSLGDLVAAIAAGKAPLAFVKADDVALGAEARKKKAELQVPGVRVFSIRTTIAR